MCERTKSIERSVVPERANTTERADSLERTENNERAVITERARRIERATTYERTISTVRANLLEERPMAEKLTVRDFFKRFPSDDACLEHVMEVRYGLRHVCQANAFSTETRLAGPTPSASSCAINASRRFVSLALRRLNLERVI